MEDFLYKFSTLPREFISDFFLITHDNYKESDLVIDFEIVAKWLGVRKGHLKRLLQSNFEENYDYVISKQHILRKTRGSGATPYQQIMITPNCFRELCMLSRSQKAKEVRKYFIEMENLIKRYHETIKNEMYKEIGLLKNNQKSKVNIEGGVLYILKAFNTSSTIYKIGKSSNFADRLQDYNSILANNIEPEFVIPVKDITTAENCVKALAKNFRYRKHKEIFELDIDVLKKLLEQ